jgi:hypothetical protein
MRARVPPAQAVHSKRTRPAGRRAASSYRLGEHPNPNMECARMESALDSFATEQASWLTEEEQGVTFQIALVGSDGLVIGSDRLGKYAPTWGARLPQSVSQPKYFVSADNSVVCFAAGGLTSIDLALQISVECEQLPESVDATELDWRKAIDKIASTLPPLQVSSQIPDEILLTRTDVRDAFWLILRGPGSNTKTRVKKIRQCFCTGASTVAQFLPYHLWSNKRPVSELTKLAVLTLSYAAEEEPSSVGPPFDIMTLDATGRITWSEHGPMHEKFQHGLERLFAECDGPS